MRSNIIQLYINTEYISIDKTLIEIVKMAKKIKEIAKKIKRCKVCNGHKTVMGLGGIEHKCKPCLGVGYVDTVDDDDTDKMLSDSANSVGVSPEVIYKRKKKTLKHILNV